MTSSDPNHHLLHKLDIAEVDLSILLYPFGSTGKGNKEAKKKQG